MRAALRLAALALLAQLATGCFVFDELDKGNKILDASSPTRNENAKKKAAAEAAKAAPSKPGETGEKKKSWWETARTLSREDKAPSDDPHVRCRIDDSERFMVQSDCVSQGGQPVF